MITYYFILKKDRWQYIKITAESKEVATEVFLFLQPSGFVIRTKNEPKYAKLYEELKQRKNQ